MNLLNVIPFDPSLVTSLSKAGELFVFQRYAVFVETKRLAKWLGWRHDNMMRSLRSYEKRSMYKMYKEGADHFVEVPWLQRFFKWLIYEALAGKPVMRRARYHALATHLGSLVGVGGPQIHNALLCDVYGGRMGVDQIPWTLPEASFTEMFMASFRDSGFEGGATLERCSAVTGFDPTTLKRHIRSMAAKDSRIRQPDETGFMNSFTVLALCLHPEASEECRSLTMESLYRSRGLRLTRDRLPVDWSDVNLHSPAAVEMRIEAMSVELDGLYRKCQTLEQAAAMEKHEELAASLLLRAENAGLQKENEMLRAGLAQASGMGFYLGQTEEGAQSTAVLRNTYGFLTVSDVASQAYSHFVDATGKPLNPRLLGSRSATRANIHQRLSALLQHMTLVKKLKAGDTPHVKPSLSGLVMVCSVRIADRASLGHLVKHNSELRSVPQVFYARMMVAWFVANGPAAIDAWADKGYGEPS